ncbi:winged helix-turn-helix domain-containing protein [Burkholderia cenocepacia]|uniref:Winged helix-turn-helix domain-containing protein n=1 Tax=Burkholderia cenocepacia TaxID=95486 RepID=A0A6B2MQ71_9BURK|nr:winged helix-turn-helix domain-containing protein [Burkholderia cenocepacia]NDV77099.1 winged helix-turn-helix domain-containing protein [Burkholderia cenocepacia]
MANGKVGPVSVRIIEFVKANPGIHAGEIARRLGKGRDGSVRETIRRLIDEGYFAKGEKRVMPSSKGHAVAPLKYTGKAYDSGYDSGGSPRSARIQDRLAAEREEQARLNESIVWAGKAIRAMVDFGRAAA